MLNDFTDAITAKDINRSIVVTSWPSLTAVNNNQVTLGHDALYLHVFARKLVCHAVEVGNKPFCATLDMWVMLNVIVADIPLHRLARSAIVEHQIIESDDIRLVLFEIDCLSPI